MTESKNWTVPYLKGLKPGTRIDKNEQPVKYRISEDNFRRNIGRLVFEVSGSGYKSFYFKYFYNGKRKFVRLGAFKENNLTPGLTLSEAREIRDNYARLVHDGVDIKTHVEQEREDRKKQAIEHEANKMLGSLGQLLDCYIEYMKETGKRSFKSVDSSLTTYVRKPYPGLIKKKATSITQEDIGDILSRMINNGVTTHSNRVRSYLHAAFQHGIKQDNSPKKYLPDQPKFRLNANPVSNIERQAQFETVREHELTPSEIVAVWNESPKEHPLAWHLMRFTLSSCQRHGELLRMKWADVDFDKREFLMPKGITKNKRDHVVPINDMAYETLNALHKVTGNYEHLFPARNVAGYITDKHTSISSINKEVAKFCSDHADVRKFQCKDTRGTVKTLMGEIGIPKEMRDRIQNHALTDVSSKHYDRYDYMKEKREALGKWNRKLESIIKGKTAKVVKIAG